MAASIRVQHRRCDFRVTIDVLRDGVYEYLLFATKLWRKKTRATDKKSSGWGSRMKKKSSRLPLRCISRRRHVVNRRDCVGTLESTARALNAWVIYFFLPLLFSTLLLLGFGKTDALDQCKAPTCDSWAVIILRNPNCRRLFVWVTVRHSIFRVKSISDLLERSNHRCRHS